MIEDRIHLRKKTGASIIDHKPVFSANSKILYIGCGPVLRSFSTDTGEHIRDVDFETISYDNPEEKPEGSIVDISLHPFDKNVIIVCFEDGRIIAWSFQLNSVVHNIALDIGNYRVTRMKLYVRNDAEIFDIVVARIVNVEVELLIFSYEKRILENIVGKKFAFLMHSWSVTERDGKQFLAGINGNALSVFNLATRKLNRDIMIGTDRKVGGERFFTCVSCHPSEECLAAGDNTGRVILYNNFLNPNDRLVHKVFHWHTLAVNDVTFTFTGTSFYSGGNEHVLVKWADENTKHCLPRLPGPIVHVTVASDNQFVALSTLDNGVLIINSQNRIHCSLQQFTWGFVSVPGQKLFPSGLVVDPRSDCIVMNGKPGHIQFFSPQYSSLIYNLDIVNQNYITQERNKAITNAEVVAINFSSDGTWLATSQCRDDPDFQSDTLLKFWLFERKSQTYKLTSCVTLQHSVTKILFQPFNLDSSPTEIEYVAATLCSDCKFRFWINAAKNQTTQGVWNCYSIGYYKDFPLGDISFSSDGSLLGATFGPCFTLWDVETNEMKCSLTKGSKSLLQIIFGSGDCSFIAVTRTDTTLYAWDLLSLTLIWSCEMSISFIVPDPRSEYFAVFTLENSLYVFRASSSDYVYHRDNLCDDRNDVLNAIFFPTTNSFDFQKTDLSSHWLCNSSLYFFNSCQELMVFEYRGKETKSDNLAFISEKSAATPFQALVARQTASSVEKKEIKSHLQLGGSWSQTVAQFINSPAHTMPPVHLLTEPLLKSLIISRDS
ncbi:WD repeat-containing protein 75 [Planococcus citri]|uniref:WD repeat-containing protein 75 n=1 Tax=Planococcus citri TaxID=170843 RepID=UPI0031F930F3